MSRWLTLLATALLAACQTIGPGRNEDRAAIHELLVDYGRTLDARDFDGFDALFARNGVYVAGGGTANELSGAQAGEADIKGYLAQKFVKWMVPDAYVFVDAIPRTSTGKFLKTALREKYRDWKWAETV